MSLSWRKRQAQASDQKSWRALGTDSALWKGIEKNSGNVKVALGGTAATSTDGIVTGLKFKHTEAIAFGATNEYRVPLYVSDASNILLAAPAVGLGQWDTPYDVSMNCRGSGLVFCVHNFNTQLNSIIGDDISGCRYTILEGGSGYSKGETFSIPEEKFDKMDNTGDGDILCEITSVTSTKIEPGRN